MKRRTFIATSAAFLTAGPVLALGKQYEPGLVKRELRAGKTVFLDFYTDWCTTCRSQHRTMDALKAANPAYEANISFVAVDMDQYYNSDLRRRLKIPRRSTLVVLKGRKELGRIVAGTGEAEIKSLMDAALSAAMV